MENNMEDLFAGLGIIIIAIVGFFFLGWFSLWVIKIVGFLFNFLPKAF